MSSAYSLLKLKSNKDSSWKIASRCAIGNQDSEVEINVSDNTQCSSLLELTDKHLDSFPSSSYCKMEKIQIFKLDTIAKNFFDKNNDVILLKIDTQGFERQVLEGAKNILPNILGIQIELSLTQLYKDEMLYDEMIKYLRSFGYELYAIVPGFTDKNSGRMLQMDGLFLRSQL